MGVASIPIVSVIADRTHPERMVASNRELRLEVLVPDSGIVSVGFWSGVPSDVEFISLKVLSCELHAAHDLGDRLTGQRYSTSAPTRSTRTQPAIQEFNANGSGSRHQPSAQPDKGPSSSLPAVSLGCVPGIEEF